MNVVVEALPNCIATLRVEVDPQRVTQAREELVAEFGRSVRVAGFRQGKAPRSIVEKRFSKQIREELEGKLLRETTRDAIRDQNLKVLQISGIEDVKLGDDNQLSFTATVVTQPQFELPNYKGLAIEAASTEVSDADVDEAINNLREQAADFSDVPSRPAEMEDYVVVDYSGTIEGKPVHEVFPKAGKTLTANEDFWIKMTPEAFFPGYCAQLVGAAPGEAREFEVTVPEDFPVEGMPGKQILYKVTLKAIKTKQLPELNDEFANSMLKGKALEELRQMAREEIGRQKESQAEIGKRKQVMQQLLQAVECELPSSILRSETQRLISELVAENRARGVEDEVLKGSERELVGAAAQGAREKVKGSFILLRIAEAEALRVGQDEIFGRVAGMAQRYEMPFEKMFKELEKRNALDEIHQELLTSKALDFVVASSTLAAAQASA
jgi:trigger factor